MVNSNKIEEVSDMSDMKRVNEIRVAFIKCKEFLNEYTSRKNVFFDMLYSSEEIKIDDVLLYKEYLLTAIDFDEYTLAETYIYYGMLDPVLISMDEISNMGEVIEAVREIKNDIQYMTCLIDFMFYLINPSETDHQELIIKISNLLNTMNESAAWGKFWGLEVRDYDTFINIENYFDDIVEEKLNQMDFDDAEDFLNCMNKYRPITEVLALLRAYLQENGEAIENCRRILKTNSSELNIYQLDWENNNYDIFTNGAISVFLLNRYLPLIDLLYFLLNENRYRDEIFPYFLQELHSIREYIIKHTKQLSVAKYDYESSTKLVYSYVNTNHKNNKELTYKLLLKAISSSDIEGLLNAKRNLSGLYAMDGEECEEIENIIESICEQIWEKIEVQEGRTLYKNEIESLLHIYGIDYDLNFLSTLSTAEYLYNRYMIIEKEKGDFDYSFVSIMYYTALECLANELFYTPYVDYIKEKDYKNNISHYFSDNRDICVNRFFRKNKIKRQVEIGTLGVLFSSIMNVNAFKNFCIHQLGMNTQKIRCLEQLGAELAKAADNRNKAAHGTDSLKAKDAKKDKTFVYNKEVSNIYLGLVIKCLEIVKK